MGEITKLYYRNSDLPERENKRQLFIDIAENIHIHYRDLRMEFSREEYFDFMERMTTMYEGMKLWKKNNPNWKESDPATFNNQSVEWVTDYTPNDSPLKPTSDYWDARISVEKNKNGLFHIHWRNYRMEMRAQAFSFWIDAFKEVLKQYDPVFEVAEERKTKKQSHASFDLKNLMRRILNRLKKIDRYIFPTKMPIDRAYFRKYLIPRDYDWRVEKIKLMDLKAAIERNGLPITPTVDQTPAAHYLNGDRKAYEEYYKMLSGSGPRTAYRYDKLIASIKEKGICEKTLIVVNPSNVILDGQLRAAVFYHLYGNIEIPIIRLHYK